MSVATNFSTQVVGILLKRAKKANVRRRRELCRDMQKIDFSPVTNEIAIWTRIALQVIYCECFTNCFLSHWKWLIFRGLRPK
jgi:hypothetical protein